jgi:hypothetical protein
MLIRGVGGVQVEPKILDVLTEFLEENAVMPGNFEGQLASLSSRTMIAPKYKLTVKWETKVA